MPWEDVLDTFAETAVTKRGELTAKQWILAVDYDNSAEGVSKDWDYTGKQSSTKDRGTSGFDIVAVAASDVKAGGGARVGVKLNWPEFDNPSGPWAKILSVGGTVLDPLVGSPNQNQVLSFPSFTNAINSLTNAANTMQRWADRFAEEAKNVESNSNFKGETAKSFQSMLQNGSRSLQKFAETIGDPVMLNSLAESRDKYFQEVAEMLQGFISWRDHNSNLMSPAAAVQRAFNDNVRGVTVERPNIFENLQVKTIHTSWGDFEIRDSWEENLRGNIERAAKDLWLGHFAGHLDPPPNTYHGPLVQNLQTTANRINADPKIEPFASTHNAQQNELQKQLDDFKKQYGDQQKNLQDSLKEQQDQQKQELQDLQSQNDLQNQDGLDNLKDQGGAGGLQNELGGEGGGPETSELNGGTGPDADLTGGDTDVDAPELDGLDENNGLGGSTSETLGLTSGNGDDQFAGGPVPHGLGGGPITSGLNSSGNGLGGGPDGFGQSSIFTPDGELVRGPDGTPLSVPNGSTINPDGTITKPDGTKVLGPDGKPLVVPEGSSIKPNTAMLNPNGSQYTDSNGNPLYGPRGSYLSPTGHMLDQNGRMIFGPGGKPITVPDAVNHNKLALNNPGVGKKFALSPGEISDPMKRATMNSSALNEKLSKPFSMATETSGLGRGGQNGQQPMMPPPAMGGGAGGQNEQKRQSSTWLQEEEETWGVAHGFTGPIGR
ncbi:hypothetical protein SAMN02982929_05338 [Saccharopolyspora kobensis]|uniref:Uncharacterized protein n=1 Tax=Saccharopolyspora kobensis TaxID=146035 RepID=A0A1H6E042_9PSEU|nr:hypothetical protein [Saccharopolyspora kobensis]SEG90907.1 hypothetical protein SAMN02982929_05338 [Saccharopolyspora kobensis]SFD94592.1 hypothetical protein SAMN05216506_107314 [Saccharopolyspora kobensis]